jgi:hypothetical protein
MKISALITMILSYVTIFGAAFIFIYIALKSKNNDK